MVYQRRGLGGEPFFYTYNNNEYIYDKELTNLFTQLKDAPLPNITAMSDFLWHGAISPHATMYADIFRLPPGHRIEIEHNRVSVARSWYPESIEVNTDITFEEAVETFQKLLKKSIVKNLSLSNAPIACELSGGFDSSTIVCLLKEATPDIISLTMDFEETRCDERSYVDIFLEKCPVKNVRHHCSHLDYANNYNMTFNYRLSKHYPLWTTFTMSAPLIEYLIHHEIRTVFTGQMGDHLLSAHREAIINHFKNGNILRFFNEWSFFEDKWYWLLKQIRNLFVSHMDPDTKNLIKKYIFRQRNKQKTPAPNFREFDFDIESLHLSRIQKKRVMEVTGAHFYWYIDSSPDYALKEKYGIEYIHPFADEALVEFLLSLPAEFLYSQGNHRYFHKKAMEGIVPDQILNRTDKAEFSDILLKQIEAVDRKHLWQNASIVALDLIDTETITWHEDLFAKKQLRGYDLQRYWRIINLEHWYNLNPYIVKTNPNSFFEQ